MQGHGRAHSHCISKLKHMSVAGLSVGCEHSADLVRCGHHASASEPDRHHPPPPHGEQEVPPSSYRQPSCRRKRVHSHSEGVQLLSHGLHLKALRYVGPVPLQVETIARAVTVQCRHPGENARCMMQHSDPVLSPADLGSDINLCVHIAGLDVALVEVHFTTARTSERRAQSKRQCASKKDGVHI
jgi:hypothetical protein